MIDSSSIHIRQHGATRKRGAKSLHGTFPQRLDDQDPCLGRWPGSADPTTPARRAGKRSQKGPSRCSAPCRKAVPSLPTKPTTAMPSAGRSERRAASPTSPPSATADRASPSVSSSTTIAARSNASSENSSMPEFWRPATANELKTFWPSSSSAQHVSRSTLTSLLPREGRPEPPSPGSCNRYATRQSL